VIPVRLPEAEFAAIAELAEREVRANSNILQRYAVAAVQEAGLLPAPDAHGEREAAHEVLP
jgi:hypothetical protein